MINTNDRLSVHTEHMEENHEETQSVNNEI